MNSLSWTSVVVFVLMALIAASPAGCSKSADPPKGKTYARSPAAPDAKKIDKKSLCEALERYIDDVAKIYHQSTRSVRTSRGTELDKFQYLKRKFERSPEFEELPDHIRDYVLMHDEAWQRCRNLDDSSGCRQAESLRQTLTAMCNQWRAE